MAGEAPVQADARRVIDWYRERLAAEQHNLAFATCALAAEQEQVAGLRGDLAEMRVALNELQDAVSRASSEAHWLRPEHPDFPAWVSQHWDEIQDARLAHMVEQAHPVAAVAARPVVREQP